MHGCDFNNNGASELFLSRDDGTIEYYAYDIDDELKV